MARKNTVTITDPLGDKQAEVTDLIKRVGMMRKALGNAKACATDTGFRANLLAAYDAAQALIDEIRPLVRCDACKHVYCKVGCPRRAGILS